jgi:sulfate permease, SulP family
MRSLLFGSLRGYRTGWLSGDGVAGLTVWAVLVPEALAYATIAGVSPVVGLYAAPAALIFYAAFGSSRHLVVGPMSATAALSAATVGEFATQGSKQFVAMTAALAITTGLAALVAGLARLGFLANFISEPVLKGFIVGLALTIIMGQLPALFGVEKGSGNFFAKLWDLITKLGDTSATTLLVGVLSLVLVLGLKRAAPVVPASLAAVALGVVAVKALHLDDHGVAIVGPINSGLPSVGVPDVNSGDFADLVGPALGVMLIGFAEGLGAAKTYATREHYEIDANRELLGLGAANMASGLASGMVVNGSLSKTAVNGAAGARSQISGLVCAGLTVLTLLFLTSLFEDLPEATLAAVVIAAVMELVDIGALTTLYRVYTRALGRAYGGIAARPDFIAALAAMAGVLIFDTLPGLFLGIAISLLLLVYRASRPHIAVLGRVPGTADQWVDVERHPQDEPVPGVVVLRVESGLFFANADHVRATIRRHVDDDTRAVVLDAETMPFVDVTAARMLEELAEDLRRDGVALVIARDIGQVRDVLRRAGADAPLVQVHRTIEDAVEAALGAPVRPRD